MDIYTLLYLKWITNKVQLYRTGNSAQCYVPAWMGRELGEEHVGAKSLHHLPETVTALLISYIPI